MNSLQARAGITEVHFLPFNPVDKRTALTYIDGDGIWHRITKGAPEQILELCDVPQAKVKEIIALVDSLAVRGFRSLGLGRQQVPEKCVESPGGPWEFLAVVPVFDPPRFDSANTIKRALELGVNVKMITGNHFLSVNRSALYVNA